jgi:hypothetical protein
MCVGDTVPARVATDVETNRKVTELLEKRSLAGISAP